jgi:hypothetical protein
METVAFLRRHIEQNEWQDTTLEPGWSSALPVKALESEPERYECWLTESLLTGLTTTDPLIAFRCSLQASAYREKLPGRGGSRLCDAFMELRNRVEAMLRSARP